MSNGEEDLGAPLRINNLFEVSVIVTEKNGKPAVELRSLTTNLELIKLIISSTYHGKPLIFMPKFTNTMQSLNTCVQKGILYQDNDKFFFTI